VQTRSASATRDRPALAHGDQPILSQGEAARSIIYLGMEVHKDSITTLSINEFYGEQ
jgi:hypothetical protein